MEMSSRDIETTSTPNPRQRLAWKERGRRNAGLVHTPRIDGITGNTSNTRFAFSKMVPGARVELARYHYRRILSPLRLPFRHPGRWISGVMIVRVTANFVNHSSHICIENSQKCALFAFPQLCMALIGSAIRHIVQCNAVAEYLETTANLFNLSAEYSSCPVASEDISPR